MRVVLPVVLVLIVVGSAALYLWRNLPSRQSRRIRQWAPHVYTDANNITHVTVQNTVPTEGVQAQVLKELDPSSPTYDADLEEAVEDAKRRSDSLNRIKGSEP